MPSSWCDDGAVACRSGLGRETLDVVHGPGSQRRHEHEGEFPMRARITTAWIRSGQLDEAARLVREVVLPTARAQPGFQGVLHLADPANGRLLVLTLWDSEASMEAGETAGYYQTQI